MTRQFPESYVVLTSVTVTSFSGLSTAPPGSGQLEFPNWEMWMERTVANEGNGYDITDTVTRHNINLCQRRLSQQLTMP